jgi:hypothetical protein
MYLHACLINSPFLKRKALLLLLLLLMYLSLDACDNVMNSYELVLSSLLVQAIMRSIDSSRSCRNSNDHIA